MVTVARTVSKRTTRREFSIQKKLYKLLPKNVPKPISYKNGVMTMNKCGVSVKKWLCTHKYTNKTLAKIIRNVRLILDKIRRRYPGFRHMDLHAGNVLVYKDRIMIIDFGLSRFNANNLCPCYDLKMFTRSLKRFVSRAKKMSSSSSMSAASIAKRLLIRA